MNKDALADKVAAVLGGSGAEGRRAVDAVFDAITSSLASGDEVKIAGFGTFRAKMAKAREARNPRTGEVVHVPAARRPRFTAGKALKDAVK
jgi:DNA-binding protein HU-beta